MLENLKEYVEKGFEWIKANPVLAGAGFLLAGGGSYLGIRYKGLGLLGKKGMSEKAKAKARRTRLRRMRQRAFRAGRNSVRRWRY